MATLQRDTGVSNVVTSAPPVLPTLRLRPTGTAKPVVQFLSLRDLSKRQDVVKALLQLRSLVADLTEDEVREATRRLFLLLSTVDDVIVKEKSVDLLGCVACHAKAADVGQIAVTLLSSLRKTEQEAVPVVCQLLLSLAAICQRWSNENETCQDVALECLPVVSELLPTAAASVRRAALHMLAALAPIDQRLRSSSAAATGVCAPSSADGASSSATTAAAVAGNSAWLLDIHRHCAAGISDDEPRVRAAAMRGLLCMNDMGLPLQCDIYQRLAPVLVDDYAEVRQEALKLVWRLCREFPDKMVRVGDSGDLEMTLLDDGFVKICDMMNDNTMSVRWKAASLLGSLHNVSFKFLQQTLDKKLMSHLRAKRSEHEKLKERYRTDTSISEWESGRHWSSDAKKKDFDPTEVQLIGNGACGAFVHGLEDEFLEVRSASVESMASLAVHRPKFAALCVDYIVDMLNDEIQAVRLAAMECLQKIMTHLELRDDQLETFLSGLSDSSSVARCAVRDLITVIRLSSTGMLNTVLKALQSNWSRYPADTQSIYQCMATLGRRHSNLVMATTPSLLKVDSTFAPSEPSLEEPIYIAQLILIFNALPLCPTLKASFPTFMAKHYAFLLSSMPDLLPKMEVVDNQFVTSSRRQSQRKVKMEEVEGQQFIEQSLTRAFGMQSGCTRLQFLKATLADLRRLTDLKSPAACLASWACLYLEACCLLENGIHCKSSGAVSWNRSQAAKVWNLSYQAEFLYTGLTGQEQMSVAELRLVAHAMHLLHASSLTRHDVQLLLKRARKLHEHCRTYGLAAGPCLQHFLARTAELERGRTSATLACLQEAVKAWSPALLLPSLSRLRKCSAKVDESSCPDHIFEFCTSLATSFRVAMTVSNTDDVRKLIVQVLFPDQTRQLVHASPADVQQRHVAGSGRGGGGGGGGRSGHAGGGESDKGNARCLVVNTVIGHHLWAESSQVEVSAVLSFVPDLEDELSLLSTTSNDSSGRASVSGSMDSNGGGGGGVLASSSSSSSTGLPPLTPALGTPAGSLLGGAGMPSAMAAAAVAPGDLLLSDTELLTLSHALLPLGNSVRYAVHPVERVY